MVTTKRNAKIEKEIKTSRQDYLDYIQIRGACENNLKNVDIDIPKNKFVVITGPSGSGKSSLAFDTIYAEGQRRYMESLSSHAKYFMGTKSKPQVESIKGITPSIAIDQRTTSNNPRSTVGTTTEIYDLVRLLFARVGKVFSPKTGKQLYKYNEQQIVAIIALLPLDTKFRLLTPIIKCKKGNFTQELLYLKQQGYDKVRIDGKFVPLVDDKMPELDAEQEHTIEIVVSRIIAKQNMDTRIHDAVNKCLKISKNIVILNIVELPEGRQEIKLDDNVIAKVGEFVSFSTRYICPECDFVIDEIEPKLFSFNTPDGACRACNGLGTEVFFKEELIVPDENISLAEGAIEPWHFNDQRYHNQMLIALSKKYNFSINIPYKDLPSNIKHILMYGSNGEDIEFEFEENMRRIKSIVPFIGVIGELQAKMQSANDDPIVLNECEKYQTLVRCHECNGYRLNKNVLQVKVLNKNIGEICDMPIDELTIWMEDLPNKIDIKDKDVVLPIIKEILTRLGYLSDVGLNYLSLLRSSTTLSGGEAQRIRLATQIGTGLCGLTYILDEPSIGLHQADNVKLISTIKKLRDIGNSVIVVEHDEDTMRNADYLIDVGPGAGKYGGKIIDAGTPEEIIKNKKGATGKFLAGETSIPVIGRRKYGNDEFIELIGACENNLKNVSIKLPLGKFIAVSGVSGSGKSTLILDTLYPALAQLINHATKIKPGKFKELKGTQAIDKVIKIDQDPIGRTPRSNPATYIGIFTMIRDIFVAQPEALAREYRASRFSFNVKGGRCENCQGDGVVKVEMSFLPDVYVKCPICNGERYNKETLEIKYKGYSINDILEMSVKEAMTIFEDEVPIMEKLKALYNVGLDYIKLGQRATTLSGGEAQRIKLAKELSRKSTGNTLYILDEPTTGLHNCDIKKLLDVLQALVDYGNTVLVIEHNLDVIKTADHVIDIGPRGGNAGGQIVAEGTPEEISSNPNSITGQYLKPLLAKKKKNEFSGEKN